MKYNRIQKNKLIQKQSKKKSTHKKKKKQIKQNIS